MFAETNVKYFRPMKAFGCKIYCVFTSTFSYRVVVSYSVSKFEMISSMFADLPDFLWWSNCKTQRTKGDNLTKASELDMCYIFNLFYSAL